MTVTFKGEAKRLDDIDLPRIGAMIGVGEDELHAFMDVEAAGSGFDSQGRVKMLFEPHVFYRNLSGLDRDKAVAAKLAYAKWRPGNYPADSYPRFEAACKINETAACKAASWGLGQILGENHEIVGFQTPQAMIAHFAADEEEHLLAIVKFLIAKKIDGHLRAHNWAGVARLYNGAGYKANRYDEKMEEAFAKWRAIRDTPYNGEPAPAPLPKPDDAQGHKPQEPPDYKPQPTKPGSGIAKAVLTAIGLAIAAFFTWIATGGD